MELTTQERAKLLLEKLNKKTTRARRNPDAGKHYVGRVYSDAEIAELCNVLGIEVTNNYSYIAERMLEHILTHS